MHRTLHVFFSLAALFTQGSAVPVLVEEGEVSCTENASFASESLFAITWYNQVCSCGFDEDDVDSLVAEYGGQTNWARLTDPCFDGNDVKKRRNRRLLVDDEYSDVATFVSDESAPPPNMYPTDKWDYTNGLDSDDDVDVVELWSEIFPEEVRCLMQGHRELAPEIYDYMEYKTPSANASGSKSSSGPVMPAAVPAAYPEILPASVVTNTTAVSTETTKSCSMETKLFEKPRVGGSTFGVKHYFTSFDGTHKLELQPHKDTPQQYGGESDNDYAKLVVDQDNMKQTMDGFGATLTESSAYVLMDLKLVNCSLYWDLMARMFGCDLKHMTGACFRVVRVPLSSSEFIANATEGFYTHDDHTCDFGLEKVSLDKDTDYIIPILKDILKINPDIKLYGVPFSAPRWMKKPVYLQRGEMFFSKKNYETYAKMLAKVLHLYKSQFNMTFEYISVQNEPLNFEGAQGPAMRMWPAQQATFIPKLKKELQAFKLNTKILAFEHNWNQTVYAEFVLEQEEAYEAADGVAFHCYDGVPEKMMDIAMRYPTKSVHVTQCRGFDEEFAAMAWSSEFLYTGGVLNHAQTIMHWPLALDVTGGPRKDGCVDCKGLASIYVNRTDSKKPTGTYSFSQEYYGLAMISQHLHANAIRLWSEMQGDETVIMTESGGVGCLWGSAYLNQDDNSVVIALHQNCITPQFLTVELLSASKKHLDPRKEYDPGFHVIYVPRFGSLALLGRARKAGAVVYDGYYSGCKVFADADSDLQHDHDEPFGITDQYGRNNLTSMSTSLVVRPGEGCVDQFSGAPLRTVMRAPAGSPVVTPLTTAYLEMLETVELRQNMEREQRLKQRKSGELSQYQMDFQMQSIPDADKVTENHLRSALNLPPNVDFFNDVMVQMRDNTTVAVNLTKAYSKFVQIHGQNSIVQALYLHPSDKEDKDTDSVFYKALAGLIVDGMLQKVNFSDVKSLKLLDIELHRNLKDHDRYRFSKDDKDKHDVKSTWMKVNAEIMKWFDIVEGEIVDGEDQEQVEQSVRKTVAKLTQLSCSLNSPELMDHIIEEVHSGDKQWEKYVAAFEHHMNEKCASSKPLDEFWDKKDENSDNTYSMAILLALSSLVGVLAIALVVYVALRFLAQKMSPTNIQMTNMVEKDGHMHVQYTKVGSQKSEKISVVSAKANAYGSTDM